MCKILFPYHLQTPAKWLIDLPDSSVPGLCWILMADWASPLHRSLWIYRTSTAEKLSIRHCPIARALWEALSHPYVSMLPQVQYPFLTPRSFCLGPKHCSQSEALAELKGLITRLLSGMQMPRPIQSRAKACVNKFSRRRWCFLGLEDQWCKEGVGLGRKMLFCEGGW